MKLEITKTQFLKELKQICKSLDKGTRLTIDSTCSNYEYVLNELQIQNNKINKITKASKKECNLNLDFYFLCYELYQNIISNFYFFFEKSYFENKINILKWNFQDKQQKYRNPNATIILIKATQVNYLLGIKNLILTGLDYQANVLIRSYIELNDLQIALIGNEELCKTYCFKYDDEERIDYSYINKLYNSYSKPSKLRFYIEQSLIEIGIDSRLIEIIKKHRGNYYYDDLSSYIHPEPLSILFGIMPFDDVKKDWKFNVFGGYSIMSKYNLNKLLFYGFNDLYFELELLMKKHNINDKIVDKELWDIIKYKFLVYQEISKKYLLPNM
jgi:hypothetical protein